MFFSTTLLENMVSAPLDNDILHSFSPAKETPLQKNTANGYEGQRSERPHKYTTDLTQLLIIMPNNTCFRKKWILKTGHTV